jgi:hypothetical protein
VFISNLICRNLAKHGSKILNLPKGMPLEYSSSLTRVNCKIIRSQMVLKSFLLYERIKYNSSKSAFSSKSWGKLRATVKCLLQYIQDWQWNASDWEVLKEQRLEQ